MNARIQEKITELNRKLGRADMPPAEKQQVLAGIRDTISTIQRRETPGAFSRHVSNYIEDAYRTRESNALCGCADMLCPIKQGRVPPELEYREYRHFRTPSRRSAATRFLERHPQAWVVRDAVIDWDREPARIETDLDGAIRTVNRHLGAGAAESTNAVSAD